MTRPAHAGREAAIVDAKLGNWKRFQFTGNASSRLSTPLNCSPRGPQMAYKRSQRLLGCQNTPSRLSARLGPSGAQDCGPWRIGRRPPGHFRCVMVATVMWSESGCALTTAVSGPSQVLVPDCSSRRSHLNTSRSSLKARLRPPRLSHLAYTRSVARPARQAVPKSKSL